MGRDQFRYEINIHGFAAQWSLKDQTHLNGTRSGFINAEFPAASSEENASHVFNPNQLLELK